MTARLCNLMNRFRTRAKFLRWGAQSPARRQWTKAMKQTEKVLPLALALAAPGLNLSPIQQVKGAGFVSVRPMNRARNFHTATLLPNGKVLVAGGQGDGTGGTELFDPATGNGR